MVGEIRARSSHLQLAEGANFNGQIRMIDGEEAIIPTNGPASAPQIEAEVEV